MKAFESNINVTILHFLGFRSKASCSSQFPVASSRAVIPLSSLSSDDDIDFNMRAVSSPRDATSHDSAVLTLHAIRTTRATKTQVRIRTRRAELKFQFT